LYDYVDKLAARISLFPQTALYGAKRSINRSVAPPLKHLLADGREFFKQQSDPLAQEIGKRAAALTTNETVVEVELNLADAIPLLYQ
jgi:hypothetical protein